VTLPAGGRIDAVEPHPVPKLRDQPGQDGVPGAIDQTQVKRVIGVENSISSKRASSA
jgi:hypothetical protein